MSVLSLISKDFEDFGGWQSRSLWWPVKSMFHGVVLQVGRVQQVTSGSCV